MTGTVSGNIENGLTFCSNRGVLNIFLRRTTYEYIFQCDVNEKVHDTTIKHTNIFIVANHPDKKSHTTVLTDYVCAIRIIGPKNYESEP